ncbi:AMP-dependent synthetase and ligase [Nitrospina gracilis 3/211]|uniref:AMP-dependent synthetase and ligase n=1 Tax=Nitrospina gracilis (strain 3/211) TaxID=1266370 RepID=M1YNF9_NITG3|nr:MULTISPECIES: fatty acid CoA ligase family protein [Nitrospina]MCF8724775.1 acyl-CoA synthetase (AMP-forming)/AMP-acid ligase II [Nitrospina sp. Nb-3]CCQ92050.1 AMP-dependent synthetase and ligase [Nitrospina gracilis 3/211]
MTTPSVENIASLVDHLAATIPNRDALVVPRSGSCRRITFRQLQRETHRLADGLRQSGLDHGDRVLVMVPFGIEFVTLTFALFRIGAVPVLIDPGLDRKQVLTSIENVAPTGFIGVPMAHLARLVYRRHFKSVTQWVTVGRRWLWSGITLRSLRARGGRDAVPVATRPDDPAAILFTSGSTGPPKGVLYTHRMFTLQVEKIKQLYGITIGEVDLPTFPLFGLFGVGLGMTCVLPDMDPTRPAKVNPENILGPIKQFNITSSFGSPALWDTVARYCIEHGRNLEPLKRILIAGAPVPGSLLERFDRILAPDAKVHTPYGATEALPVCSIERREVVDETWTRTQEGAGTCVGKPVEGVDLRILHITDDPIPEWNASLEAAPGTIGEIAVSGPWVTRQYAVLDEANRLSKIKEGERTWHRMGDVGYLDEQGRLWFCGRKSHRIETETGSLFTIVCEAIFNRLPEVRRSALVGVGRKGQQIPVVVVELHDPPSIKDPAVKTRLLAELLELGSANPVTRPIDMVLFHPGFPVDIRHNAKINREKLADWAAVKLADR